MTGLKTELNRQDADTDILRVVAAFFVVMDHSTGAFTPASILYNVVGRFCVPVFLIISGYYMLARPVGPARIAKRCGGLFALMLAWSGIYFLYDVLCGVRGFTGLADLSVYLLTQPIHLWYLWALIALYLFTPPLFVFCEHAARNEYRYALLLAFAFGSPVVILLRSGAAPVLETVIDRMKAPYLLGFPFYYLLGGYFRRYGVPDRRGRRALYALALLGAAAGAALTIRLSPPGGVNELLMSFFAPNVVAAGAAVFVLVKQWCLAHPPRPSPLLRELADSMLGVYLLHPLFILMLQRNGTAAALLYRSPESLYMPLRCVLVFCASTATVLLLRRVPLLRRLVRPR